MVNLYGLLKQNELFESLGEDVFKDLAASAIKKSYQPGEIIVHQGDDWPNLFVVESGGIEALMVSLEGRQFVITNLSQGDIFWGLAFFQEGAGNPVILQAVERTTIHLWSRDVLLPTIFQHGEVAWVLCQNMAHRMQIASGLVEDLAFHPVMGRLSRLLLEAFSGAENGFVTRDMTLDDMAARIGTTRAIVCRYLYKLAEKGAVEIRRTELKITDREFLEKQSGKVN